LAKEGLVLEKTLFKNSGSSLSHKSLVSGSLASLLCFGFPKLSFSVVLGSKYRRNSQEIHKKFGLKMENLVLPKPLFSGAFGILQHLTDEAPAGKSR